jgi:FHS family L-fucose permease-like MFS transporter
MERVTDPPANPAGAPVRRSVFPFALIVALFFLWGMANNLNDILIAQFKKAFTLSDFRAGLVQSAFYLGYFLLAIPAGMFTRRFGYKGAVVVGLLLYACGAFLFWPAAELRTYGMFLGALFVLASGLAFLETSANPFATVLGPPETAAQRLNLAQAFNPLGSITGVVIGQQFIFSGMEHTPGEIAAMSAAERSAYLASESTAVQLPYLIIGLVVLAWASLILVSRFPNADAHANDADHGNLLQLRSLRHNSRFVLAVVAQFFYVGAQVGIWSYLIRYVQATLPGTPQKQAANFLTASLIAFMVGRFAGTALMRRVAPTRLLAWFAAINVFLCGIAIVSSGHMGTYALVASSFFMSIMFPTIFAAGVDGLGDSERKLGAALLVMAIIGGAVLTAAMGAISDAGGIQLAMSVPLLCFAVVLIFARRSRRESDIHLQIGDASPH